MQKRTEKVTSLGKDWHKRFLRNGKCRKPPKPGNKSEEKGKPYGHNPYSAGLFGPGGFRAKNHKY